MTDQPRTQRVVLAELAEAARRIRESTELRNRLTLEALALGVGGPTIAKAAELTPPGVYKIRDRADG